MNRKFLGDSYDLVKRFFCLELSVLGYQVVADPMFTGPWNDRQKIHFFRLIGVAPTASADSMPMALFLDPDTGIRERSSRQHVAFKRIAEEAARYALVFSFDQSFSYQEEAADGIQRKLAALKALGCESMYYDSHARFVFASCAPARIAELRKHLMALGLPPSRLIDAAPN